MKKRYCIWEYDDLFGCHNASCGYMFNIDIKTPKELGFIYCPNCGKIIIKKKMKYIRKIKVKELNK